MITTGIVGGGSCGRDVSSRSGIAKACAKTGTEEKQQKTFIEAHIKNGRERQRAKCALSLQSFHVSGFILFEQVQTSLPSLSVPKGGEKLLFILLLCIHTQTWPSLSVWDSHTLKHPNTTQCVPAFLFSHSSTSTHPLSRHTWPAARLASVNPRRRSLNKREF